MRKKRYLEKKKSKDKTKALVISFLWALLLIFVFTLIFLVYKLFNQERFEYLRKSSDGGAEIVIIKPEDYKITIIKIDKDYELDTAKSYGKYKLGNLWTLAQKEGYGGELVVESVNKNIFSPLYFWEDGKNGNMTLTQKIFVKFVSIGPWSYDLERLDLSKSKSALALSFNREDWMGDGFTLEVNDLTGNVRTVQYLSSILNNLGLKINTYSRGYDENLDCIVYSGNIKLGQYVSQIFKCNFEEVGGNNLRIDLGLNFANRF